MLEVLTLICGREYIYIYICLFFFIVFWNGFKNNNNNMKRLNGIKIWILNVMMTM